MGNEKKLRYMLERLDSLNEIIDKADEAKKEREQLRIEISELMQTYLEELNIS